MSDNFVANPGSGGSNFAADDVGAGLLVPRVKQSVGSDGVAQDNWTPSRIVSASGTNATSIKASAGAVGFISAQNSNAAVRFLKLYNKASAPSVGTDTPVWTVMIPGNTAGAGIVIPIPGGIAFSTGIAAALTTGAADSDTGAVAANEIVVQFGYA